jgi:hypothetical protein
LPVIAPGDEGFFAGQDLDPYKKEESNVVNGLERAMKDLRDAEATAEQKAIALCWLLHLAGDIHQPLHSAAFYSEKDYSKGDEGGNSWWVKKGNTPIKLHAYWDDIPGVVEEFDHLPAEVGPMAAMYRRVSKNYEILTREDFDRKTYAVELKRTGYKDWAAESLALANDKAYRSQGELIGGFPFSKQEPTAADRVMLKAKAPRFPEGYTDTAAQVANRQLALAGHRLADQLKTVFPGSRNKP